MKNWQGHEAYSVWSAACLWVPMEPEVPIPDGHPAYAALSHIKGALLAKTIKSLDGSVNMQARVSNKELTRHAFSRGEFPKFLFPDKVT